MTYTRTISRPPTTLTTDEQALILRVTGEHKRGFRDHCIIAMALGTGLRSFEIVALNVGDIYHRKDGIKPRRRVTLKVFKKATDNADAQQVFIPDSLFYKLRRFLTWKKSVGESVEFGDPLFVSRGGGRISTRQLRRMFEVWQTRARFDRLFTFHHLRHTCLTRVYEKTRDIRLTQKVARHKNINTTTVYAIPSDDDVLRAVRKMAC